MGHLVRLTREGPGFLEEALSQYGDQVWVDWGFGEWYLIVGGDSSFSALMKGKHTSNQHLQSAIGHVMGEKIVASQDGAEHRRIRGAIHRPFTPQGIERSELGAIMKRVVDERTSRIAQQDQVNMLEETRTLAMDIILRIMGISLEGVEAWHQHFAELVVGFIPVPVDLPGFPRWRSRRAKAWLDTQIQALIDKARAAPEAPGLLPAMVAGKDEQGNALGDEELLDNIRLLLVAGHETTASTMLWMVSHLAADDRLWDAVSSEVDAAGGLPEGPATLVDFPITEGLFREALRLYPPVIAHSRESCEGLVIGERPIPPGIRLMTPIALLGRDPTRYPDPEKCDPWRWSGRDHKPTMLEMGQFGAGPHFCLGYHLAWLEAVQFGAGLVHHLNRLGKRPQMRAIPRPEYLMTVMRPKGKDCVVKLRSV